MTGYFEHILTNGVRLHTHFSGPDDGEPVFLLHGFPDAWFGWEAQIGPLSDAGYRLIVPDQRGYHLSDKPQGTASYKMDLLVNDILGLADALGYDKFHLGGHDFGALVSWHVAMRRPERLKRLAIANVPHPAVLRRYLRTHFPQQLKSWYAFFFQLPRLPEWVVRANNWQFLISALPDDLTDEGRQRYREAWNQPGAITGMINWYRALMQNPSKSTGTHKIQVPTLILWGKQDPYLSYEMAPASLDLCENGLLVTYEDASHWVLHDKSAEVSRQLTEFFG